MELEVELKIVFERGCTAVPSHCTLVGVVLGSGNG